MDAVCTQVCPITAEYLNMTAQFLGPQASQVNWVAISVNPSNTPAQVDAFLTKNKVTIPLHFLLGTQTQLAPLWSAYHQEVILSQQTGSQDTGHTANTYILDAHGHEQEVLDQTYDPKALAADLRVLLQQP